ncbi:hypothetical protein DWU98_01690 [Dyella monticola]|uniref:Uncharacterized protein n=1 Tax=Dyella monticola TaxID=1927958 RepID=A0A370X8F9_9GAMM|nr:hypothetical protein [Dyella monticola]RDS84703.1 hypothetical protein DWU98_01690 [Dyella monticola]
MKRYRLIVWSMAVVLGATTAYAIHAWLRPTDIVILNAIGEPYEQVRAQSRSTLPPMTEWNFISLYVTRPAIFRFNDPIYGFTTPAAKFLTPGVEREGNVYDVTLSPQKETLPLDASMRVLIDLQNQFRRGGWRPILVSDSPPH